MFEVLKMSAFSVTKYNMSDLGSYGLAAPTPSPLSTSSVWIVISAVLAIVGALVAYFFFARQPRDKFKGFLAKVHDFANFKRLRVEAILKLSYFAMAIFITLGSFELIGTSFVSFIATLVFGNITLWATFQFAMIMVKIYRNLVEINEKLTKSSKK